MYCSKFAISSNIIIIFFGNFKSLNSINFALRYAYLHSDQIQKAIYKILGQELKKIFLLILNNYLYEKLVLDPFCSNEALFFLLTINTEKEHILLLFLNHFLVYISQGQEHQFLIKIVINNNINYRMVEGQIV